MSKLITVTIKRDGNVQVKTTGYTGNSCHEATQSLEKALGRVDSTKPTAEACEATAGQRVAVEVGA